MGNRNSKRSFGYKRLKLIPENNWYQVKDNHGNRIDVCCGNEHIIIKSDGVTIHVNYRDLERIKVNPLFDMLTIYTEIHGIFKLKGFDTLLILDELKKKVKHHGIKI